MKPEPTLPEPVTKQEFDAVFEAVRNWGRWVPTTSSAR
jgi:hypothetical protein